MIECEQFADGTREREVCEGTADLPPEKIDAYRERWGLAPLTEGVVIRKMPPLHKQMWNFASSLTSFVSDGFHLVDKADYQKRLEVCNTCDSRQDGRCLKCGCYLSAKAKVRVDKCPEGKWLAIKSPEVVDQAAETSVISQEITVTKKADHFRAGSPKKKTPCWYC